MELCRFLRWKSFHAREWFTQADLEQVLADNEVPYSCLRTVQPWGPDDNPTAPEVCGSLRPCFEASKKLVRAPKLS